MNIQFGSNELTRASLCLTLTRTMALSSLHGAVAASFTESPACFTNLLKDLNLLSVMDRLKEMGFHTMADFAQSVELNPLIVSNAVFSEKIIWEIFRITSAEQEPQPEGIQLRKLYFKCALAVAGEEKRQWERGPGEHFRELHPSERAPLRQNLVARLKPLILKGRLEHAWCIENTFSKCSS